VLDCVSLLGQTEHKFLSTDFLCRHAFSNESNFNFTICILKRTTVCIPFMCIRDVIL
jgi:hypothetical protein